MSVGFDIRHTKTKGRMLDMYVSDLGLEWMAPLERWHAYASYKELMQKLDDLFTNDGHGRAQVITCDAGLVDPRDKTTQQAITNLAEDAWMESEDSVRIYSVMPLFDASEDTTTVFSEASVIGLMGNVCARLVYEFPAIGLGARAFAFYHPMHGDDAPHFHVLCIDKGRTWDVSEEDAA